MKKILISAMLLASGLLMAADLTTMTGTCAGTTVTSVTSEKVSGHIDCIKISTTLTTTTNAVAIWLDGQQIYTNNAAIGNIVAYPRINAVDKTGTTNSFERAFAVQEKLTMTAKGAVTTQTNSVTAYIKIDDK